MDYSKTVTFTNIADFDFTPEMGAMFGGVAYPVKAGEVKVWLWDLADHIAGALAKQMFLKGDKSARIYDPKDTTGGNGAVLWTDQQLIDLKAKMLGEVFVGEKERTLTEAEKVKQKVDELNAIEPEVSTDGYRDKSEVIIELQKRGVAFDARQSKANLEKLLT